MKTPASIHSHPIHPILIAFPAALWVFSLVCDIIYHAGSHNPSLKSAAFYAIAGGLVGALLAAVPGFIDYRSLTDRRARKIATNHMVLNLIAVVLFAFNLGLRYRGLPGNETLEVVLSIVALAFVTISGWLGGILVYELGVGVAAAERKDREQRVA